MDDTGVKLPSDVLTERLAQKCIDFFVRNKSYETSTGKMMISCDIKPFVC